MSGPVLWPGLGEDLTQLEAVHQVLCALGAIIKETDAASDEIVGHAFEPIQTAVEHVGVIDLLRRAVNLNDRLRAELTRFDEMVVSGAAVLTQFAAIVREIEMVAGGLAGILLQFGVAIRAEAEARDAAAGALYAGAAKVERAGIVVASQEAAHAHTM